VQEIVEKGSTVFSNKGEKVLFNKLSESFLTPKCNTGSWFMEEKWPMNLLLDSPLLMESIYQEGRVGPLKHL